MSVARDLSGIGFNDKHASLISNALAALIPNACAWSDWAPNTYQAAGMTWGSISINHAKYISLGNITLFSAYVTGTIAGSAGNWIAISCPPGGTTLTTAAAAVGVGTGNNVGARAHVDQSSDVIMFQRYDGGNIPSGSGIGFMVVGVCITA